MTSINSNLGALLAQRYLRSNAADAAANQTRVASGQRVASVADDGASFAVGASLRADAASYAAAASAMRGAAAAGMVAISAGESISARLGDIRAKIVQLADGSLSPQNRATLNADLSAMVAGANQQLSGAGFNGMNLLSGGSSDRAVPTGPDAAPTTVRGNDLGGTSFNGAYANSQNSFLQSPSIPTGGRQGLRLRFRRFLSVVTGDVARVLVNGALVWASSGSVYDTEWQWIDYDVSSILNTASNAVVRFELTTNASNAAGGWQIDDVALVTLHDAAPATTYGTGTPGTGAIVPTLAVSAPPVLGTTVQFQAQGLLANSAGLLGLGVQPANTPVLGLQLLVDPAGLALLTAPISAGGAAAWPFAVPGTPALDNVVLYAQAFGLDGGAPGGLLSASAGLRVRLCVSAP